MHRVRRQADPLHGGTIPRISGRRAGCDLADAAQRKLDRMARRVPLEAPWAAPKATRVGLPDLLVLDALATLCTAAGAILVAARASRRSGRPSPRTCRCCTSSSTSTPAGGFDTAGRHRGRRPAGPLRRRLAARGAADGRGAGRGAAAARGAGAADRARGRRGGPPRRWSGGEPAGLTVRARRAIVAIPPTLAGRVAYDPPLPGFRDQLTQRMPQGTVIKCMAVYDEPFWRARRPHRAGDQRHRAGQGRPSTTRRPDGSARRAARLPRGPPARELGRAPRGGAARGACSTASRGSSARARREPRRYLERDWAEEEWTRGCYGCLHAARRLDRATARRCARRSGRCTGPGAETATVWNGYMDGAVSSGERAAAEVLEEL